MTVNFKDESIAGRRHWIFDMDGTLTIGIHDFEEIRKDLGLPAGKPILEAIEQLPADEAKATHQKLDELEFEIAARASPQPGAEKLLDTLANAGCKLGILTRNGRQIADATLEAANLDSWFSPDTIVSRDCCAPKPSSAGVVKLVEFWQAEYSDTVMAGDYLYDLKAGNDAGVATVHLDVNGEFAWPELTTVGVTKWSQLLSLFD